MTSYLPQAYRLSILIDKQTLFINSWLIRLSVDNVLLINTEGYQFLLISQSNHNEGYQFLLMANHNEGYQFLLISQSHYQ
jgi:hypothetical protein